MTHEMQFIRHRERGADEWCCPICGRCFLIQVRPAYKKTILVEGDLTVRHVGGWLRVNTTVETDPALPASVEVWLRELP